jgi:SAM-dependent methyltransferase
VARWKGSGAFRPSTGRDVSHAVHLQEPQRLEGRMKRRPSLPGYDAEARFYDYCWASFVDDIEFFRRRLGRPGRVLDLMCGTVRVGIVLAAAGWKVNGVDQSREMLRAARSKARSLPAPSSRPFHRPRAPFLKFARRAATRATAIRARLPPRLDPPLGGASALTPRRELQ